MKILVCAKIIPDLDQMSPKDYLADEHMQVDASFVKTMLNCFDESALEFGLRLSDDAESLNLHMEKTALTVADEKAELYLKTFNALKYDKTVRIDDGNQDLRFKPAAIAEKIAAYVKKYPQDYIFMGKQAAPGNNGMTPQLTAGMLGVPLIANIIDVHMNEEGSLTAITEEAGALYTQKVVKPAVLSVGNAVISKLRVPTLKDRMKYGKNEILVIPGEENNGERDLQPVALTYIDRERKGEQIESTGAQAAKELFGRIVQIKKGKK